jgi:hypothetical protein
MAIRPTRIGPLAGSVSARIGRGYLYVEALTSITPSAFAGSERGIVSTRVHGVSGLITSRVRTGYLVVGKASLVQQDLEHTLTLTDSAEFSGFPTSNDLSLTHDVVVNKDINETLSDTLGLSETLELTRELPQSLEDTLSFTETLTKTYELAVDDTLVLTDEATGLLTYLVSNALSLSHSLDHVREINQDVSDTLTLTQANEVTNLSQATEDTLTLTHDVVATKDIEASVDDTLSLTDGVDEELTSLTNVSATLVLSQTLSFTAVRVRALSDTLSLTEVTEGFSTPGSVSFTSNNTWVCPDGVASVIAECWGGGGGAGHTNSTIKGGGGGGGAYSKKVVLVTAGVTYTVNVGAGGAGGIGEANASDGGDTWFNTSSEILAKGGKGGTAGRVVVDTGGPYNAYGIGGEGGAKASGIGSTKTSGGLGCTGFLDGRGASSGGTSADGLDANDLPLTTVAGAGAGGIAAVGTNPGGGGGTTTGGAGRAGASGKVVLSYIPSYPGASTLTLAHSVQRVLVKDGTATSTLTLTDVVELDDSSLFKHDTLELTEDLIANVDREISISHSLTLSHDGVPGAVTFESLDHTLSLTDDNVVIPVHNEALLDTLTLSHDLIANTVRSVSISQTITLVAVDHNDNLSRQNIYQELGLSQLAHANGILRASFVDSLALVETLGYSPRYEELSNSISIAHDIVQNLVQSALSDSLVLSHQVILNCERTITFSDSLDLSDDGHKTSQQSLEDTLTLSQTLEKLDEIVSLLSLTQSVTFDTGKLIAQAVSLIHQVLLNTVLTRSISHSLTLGHTAIAIVGEYGTCTYNPISTVLPGAPTLVKASNVTYTCGVSTLILRAPAIGDSDELSYQKILTETSGGTLRNYRKSNWPKARILNYVFDNLDSDEKSEVLTFLKDSLGKQVTLVDYWGRTWIGVILNPEAVHEEASRSTRTIAVRFQGVIQ